MVTEIIFALLALYLIYYLFYKRPSGLPPGEFGWPLIGYIPSKDEPITKFLTKLKKKHGDVFCAKFGQRLVVFMTEFPTIKAVFGRPEFTGRPDFFTLRVFRRFQNKGVIISEGDVWHTNRRFALRVLRDFGLGKSSLATAVYVEVKHLLGEMMKTEGKSAVIDMCLNVSVVNVIMGITAGKRYDILDPTSIKYVELITNSFVESFGRLQIFNFQPWLVWAIPEFLKNKIFHLDVLVARVDDFLDYLRDIIREHERVLDKDNPKDFIDMYLIEHNENKGKPGSIYVEDDYFDLVSVLADLYVAGSETTSSTIRWYCYYMAKHPEIQKKIQDEIDSVVPSDRLPEYEDKERLPYFEASVCELQRIVTLTPIGLPHSAIVDSTINGFEIPKGTIVMCSAELCHKNPKYWKHPNQFYPEHFLDENVKFFLPKEGYLPFIIGRRQCLGESVAKMELVLYLSAILQTFDICEPEDNPIVLTCHPETHHNLNFPLSQELVFKKRNKT